jgi:AhpD family alkylhydroperoxidase
MVRLGEAPQNRLPMIALTMPDPAIDIRLEPITQMPIAKRRSGSSSVHRARRKHMRNSTTHLLTFATMAALGVLTALAQPVAAQEAQSQAIYRDIEQTLGSVPSFFKQLPETAIAGAWAEMKAFQLNPKTQLNGKTKELIGLAVAAQIPCQYCIYFHTAAARANGATDEEIKETVAMAAVVRHWSTVLNGMQVDLDGFKRDTDTVLRVAAEKAKAASRSQ